MIPTDLFSYRVNIQKPSELATKKLSVIDLAESFFMPFCSERIILQFVSIRGKYTLPPDLFNTSQAINQRGFTAALKQNCRNHRAQENQCNHNQQSGKHRISAQGIAHL